MFTNKKREDINRFVCDVSLYVAKTPKASIKYRKPPFPIIPFGIVAYGFVGQPFSKQLYTAIKRHFNNNTVYFYYNRRYSVSSIFFLSEFSGFSPSSKTNILDLQKWRPIT